MQTQTIQQGYDQQATVSYSPTPAVETVPLLVEQSNHHLPLEQLNSPIQGAAPGPHRPHPNHHLGSTIVHVLMPYVKIKQFFYSTFSDPGKVSRKFFIL
jgi:hypothetical protein